MRLIHRSVSKTGRYSEDITGLEEVELTGCLLLVVVGILIIVMAISSSLGAEVDGQGIKIFFRALSTGSIIALAAASVGGILGFLFGIPKLLQKNGQARERLPEQGIDPSRPGQLFVTNTSLEEISDWLTKIIIGLGLVQFQTIVNYIKHSAVYSASYISGNDVGFNEQNGDAIITGSLAVPFFFAIIVLCLLGSCLFFYLETRTRLALMLLSVEHRTSGKSDSEEALLRPLTRDNDAPFGVKRDSSVKLGQLTTTDKRLVSVSREELESPTQLAGWAAAQARAGNTRESENALADARRQDPDNIDVMMRLAELQRYQQNTERFIDTVLQILEKHGTSRQDVRQLARLAQFDALYLAPPRGFEKSIAIGKYIENLANRHQAIVHLRLACAFGQKYRYINDPDKPEAIEARDATLKSVKKVIELVPGKIEPLRQSLKQLLDPKQFGTDEDENDLEIFRDDPEFRNLIL